MEREARLRNFHRPAIEIERVSIV